VRHFDAAATARALAWTALIGALERLFVEGCEVPARQVHAVGDALTSLVMPAWQAGRFYGVKVVNVASGNAALGLPAVHASYLLFDARTGAPVASIDGSELTARRTAAASALAASRLARADARRLVVVGAGRLARQLPEAQAAVRPLEEVRVWARRAEQARALAAELRAAALPAEAVEALEPAVRGADIVSCATMAEAPLVHGAWLAPGSHLDLVGGFTPAMREADDAAFAGADVWIDTPEALAKAGDLLQPIASGALAREQVRGTLAGLCAGGFARRGDARRTVFKSVGTALEDLAAAMLVHASAG
jgi:ornithine cyclodeaminase